MSHTDTFNQLVKALAEKSGLDLEIENHSTAFKYDDLVIMLDLPRENSPQLYLYSSLFPNDDTDRQALFSKLLEFNMPNTETGAAVTIAYDRETDGIVFWDLLDITRMDPESFISRLSEFCRACTRVADGVRDRGPSPDENERMDIPGAYFLKV